MAALYKSLSIYVHTPINDHCEAFGQTYVEALMSGIPSIFTLSGIAKEFIVHKKNAYVVDYGNSNEIYNAMIYCLENPETVNQIKEMGFIDVVQKFHIEKMIISLKELYLP
jgi:glycosyltransferase involved in cell wall biosynthesis